MLQTILCIVGVCVVIMLLVPRGRALLKGFLGLFIEDIAKTPDGIRAIYQEKINELSKSYNIAHDNYKKLVGDKEVLERSLEENIRDKKDYDAKILYLINVKHDEESAKLYATKASELATKINNKKEELKKYEILIKEAKDTYDLLNKTLNDLKTEQEEQIRRLETSKQMEKVYDSIEKTNLNTSNDKLLQSARKAVNESESKALGAKTIHENNIDTRLEKLDNELNTLSTDEYISSLLKGNN